MYGFYFSWLSLLASLLDIGATLDITSPQTVEVDLIFPHNAIYTPSPIMPFVFAVQNPRLAASLDLSLTYDIYNISSSQWVGGSVLDLQPSSFSDDPYFVFHSTNQLLSTRDPYMLTWDVSSKNCSGTPRDNSTLNISSQSMTNKAWFRTSWAGRIPELDAGTWIVTCKETSTTTFNVIDTLDVPSSSDFRNDACAVLAPVEPVLAPNPCRIDLGSGTADNISAAITSIACVHMSDPLVFCRPTESSRAGDVPRAMEGSSWLAAVFGWLAYVLL